MIDDLGADSLDSVEIVMELEEAFDIEINEDEQQEIQTVSDIVNLVCNELDIK